MIRGGIDLGGSKIEARLFDGAEARTVDLRRVPTPTHAYEPMLDALAEQVDWLTARARAHVGADTDTDADARADDAAAGMPIGIAVPGIVDAGSGAVFAANLPGTEPAIGPDLERRLRRGFTVMNDCLAFTVSEATGGAGAAHRGVMGLVLGTGVGGGLCIDGVPMHRRGGVAVEIGHVGLPAGAVARHALPLWRCNCGRLGCMETCVSGTGLARIAEHRLGRPLSAQGLVEEGADDILELWADITGECLVTIQLMLAPDCIVLGGGLSNLPDVTDRLEAAFRRHALGGEPPPVIAVAHHGDSSGARGAALMAAAG